MKITNSKKSIELLSKLFDELNKEYFHGQLFRPKIKVSQSELMGGYIKYNRKYKEVVCLAISSKFTYTQDILESIMLHEMIHIWEIQIVRITPSHYGKFEIMMHEINKLRDLKQKELVWKTFKYTSEGVIVGIKERNSQVYDIAV